MAWGNNKGVSAEEILGMKPEDLKSKLDSAATKEDLKAATDAVDGLKGSLAEIQGALAKLTKGPDPVPDPAVLADQNDPTTQVLTDPAGFVARATAGTQKTALEAQAGLMEIRARQENPGVFQKFGAQLLESASKFPAEQRGTAGFWPWMIRTFVGDKYMKGELEGGSYPSLMGGSSFAPNASGDVTDPNKGFDPEVAARLKERGIPLDKAAAINKLMAVDGEPIDIERYKAAVKNVA
jgi:hypothetical protein